MRATLRLLAYLKPHWPVVVVSLVLSLLIVGLEGVSVWIGAGFIEQIATGRAAVLSSGGHTLLGRTLDAVARAVLLRETPFQSLILAVIVLVSARLLVSAARVAKIALVARTNQSILARVRRELFAHLTRLGPSFSRTARPGEVASVVSQDVEMLNGALFDVVDRSLLQPTRLAAALFLMASISFELFVWIALILLAGGLLIHRVGDRIERLVDAALSHMAGLQGHLTEYLSLAMLARLFGRESHERERFDETAGLVARHMVQIVRLRALAPELIQGAFFTGGGLLLLLAGYRIFVQGTLTGPDLLKLALLLPLCTYSTESLAGMYASLRASTASARRVFALLDLPALPPDPPDAQEPGVLRGAIELRAVGYAVGTRAILEGIDLTLPRGKRIVIQGPTGAGKSTLLSLVAGYLEPTSGEILIDGVDVRRLRLSAWRQRLGIVTQEALLVSGTVRDNLLYARPDADDAQLAAALERALLGPAARALPLGLDTPVGNRGELLSGGERQRLTIARALLREPDVLLMDEPTSMLDRASRDVIREAILSASAGRTLILVSHDESLSAIADVLVHIEAGRIRTRA